MSDDVKYCDHTMTKGRMCGRPLFHLPPHRSYEYVQAHRDRERKKYARLDDKTKLPHRGQALEMPAELLPGSALAGLANYRKSGLYKAGDPLFERIVRRLVARETSSR